MRKPSEEEIPNYKAQPTLESPLLAVLVQFYQVKSVFVVFVDIFRIFEALPGPVRPNAAGRVEHQQLHRSLDAQFLSRRANPKSTQQFLFPEAILALR